MNADIVFKILDPTKMPFTMHQSSETSISKTDEQHKQLPDDDPSFLKACAKNASELETGKRPMLHFKR